jgi:SAM-dependent methyltransferase
MKFTAHNILLSNGEKTMGENVILLGESEVWKSIVKTLDLFFPGTKEDRKKLRVVDLGCLEGGYAVEFAKLGFDTLGIEAREENLEKCNLVKNSLQLSNLNFVKDDVRNMKNYGTFDIVLCYGLLYHLNDPAEFLKTMSNSNSKLLFLNTHFAPERDIRYKLSFLNTYFFAPLQKRTRLFEYTKNLRLSPITSNEGYRGRWMKEWSKKMEKSKIEKYLWAAYNNDKSFLLCKKDLTTALHDSGYNSVFEQFNFTGDMMPHNYNYHYNRGMFVAIKH